jgi:hypothetical protein
MLNTLREDHCWQTCCGLAVGTIVLIVAGVFLQLLILGTSYWVLYTPPTFANWAGIFAFWLTSQLLLVWGVAHLSQNIAGGRKCAYVVSERIGHVVTVGWIALGGVLTFSGVFI